MYASWMDDIMHFVVNTVFWWYGGTQEDTEEQEEETVYESAEENEESEEDGEEFYDPEVQDADVILIPQEEGSVDVIAETPEEFAEQPRVSVVQGDAELCTAQELCVFQKDEDATVIVNEEILEETPQQVGMIVVEECRTTVETSTVISPAVSHKEQQQMTLVSGDNVIDRVSPVQCHDLTDWLPASGDQLAANPEVHSCGEDDPFAKKQLNTAHILGRSASGTPPTPTLDNDLQNTKPAGRPRKNHRRLRRLFRRFLCCC